MKKYLAVTSFILVLLSFNCTKSNKKQSSPSESIQDSARYLPKKYVELKHPEWSKNATIYEVNVRQYSQEGHF
jgi:hypothetical protein